MTFQGRAAMQARGGPLGNCGDKISPADGVVGRSHGVMVWEMVELNHGRASRPVGTCRVAVGAGQRGKRGDLIALRARRTLDRSHLHMRYGRGKAVNPVPSMRGTTI